MCGRFALYTPPDQLARLFDAELAAGLDGRFEPHWNIAPTTPVLGLRFGHPDRPGRADDRPGGAPKLDGPALDAPELDGPGLDAPGLDAPGPARLPLTLDQFRWGLIPPQAPDPAQGSRLFNARAETVANRPTFRDAFDHRRMVVLADGFYEWRKTAGKGRQPHYFHRADGQPLALAGVWADWRDPRPGAETRPALRSCTIVTTTASQDMDGIHDRMPAVLARDVLDVWMDPVGADHQELLALLRPAPPATLVHHPVDQRAGNVRNDDPGLIDPVPTPQATVATLF